MKSVIAFGRNIHRKASIFHLAFRTISDFNGGGGKDVPDKFSGKKGNSDFHSIFEEKLLLDDAPPWLGVEGDKKFDWFEDVTPRQKFSRGSKAEVNKIYEALQQDGPGFDARAVLDDMQIRVSNTIVREVLLMLSRSVNHMNRDRSARLAYKFFMWSAVQKNFKHTSNTYNVLLQVLADCEKPQAMFRVLKEMIDNGITTTARTFNVLLCACFEAGMARKVVEKFIMSETFNFRPFKHSFNAILHSLLTVGQYRLIEWVYQHMLDSGYYPDTLTYNVLMCAKYRLGKLVEFSRVLNEMDQNGIPPDLHTFNICLHVFGRSDNAVGAINLLNYMDKVGCQPQTLHFTSLIDGFSRAGNLDACQYFFDDMVKKGCEPDVVCYTVRITGYVVAGDLEKAQRTFDEMIVNGMLPNVFTYNSMIRGLCVAGKFEEARNMLQDMESKGCLPNFLVYSRLVANLRTAGRFSEANEIIGYMQEKRLYVHLIPKIKSYRRC